MNNGQNSSNTANTAEDLSKITKEELEKKINELVAAGKYSEISRYSEELAKREKNQTTNTPEKSTKEKMEELLSKDVLEKEDKENLKKLLEEHQREREQKNSESLKDKVNKANTATVNDLYSKLLDNYDNPIKFKKIKGTAKRGTLPFIPNYRGSSSEREKELKRLGIKTFDTRQFELLNIKRRTIRGRINRVAKYFNTLGDKETDTQKAIDYMFSMSRKRDGGKIGASLHRGLARGLRKIGLESTKQEFDKELEKQRTLFLNAISTGEEQEEEKKIMEQIDQRIKFYINNYKLMQAKKRLS